MITASLLAILYFTSPSAFQQLSIINYIDQSAKMHGLDSFIILELVSCESSFKIDATGDWRSEDQIYLSHGILQFQKPTFDYYSDIYKIKGEWKDPFTQIDLAILMIKDGLWYKWYNCYRQILRNSS